MIVLIFDKPLKIAPTFIRAAIISSPGTVLFLRTLFEHSPTVDDTQEDLMILANQWVRDETGSLMLDMLFVYGNTVYFTGGIRKRMNSKCQSHSDEEMEQMFCVLQRGHC